MARNLAVRDCSLAVTPHPPYPFRTFLFIFGNILNVKGKFCYCLLQWQLGNTHRDLQLPTLVSLALVPGRICAFISDFEIDEMRYLDR